MILEAPDNKYVKRLKDMWLHWFDLNEAKESLESMDFKNSDVVNRALAQNSIVLFYKCFGNNEFRDNSLKRDKVLANYPPEAKNVFDYYKNLRNKFIVHDESRLAQANAGVILQSNKKHPFIDTFCTVAVADKYKSAKDREGLGSFHHLITVSMQWVEEQIDKLSDLLRDQYKEKELSDFQEFERLQLNIPTQDDMYKKRY